MFGDWDFIMFGYNIKKRKEKSNEKNLILGVGGSYGTYDCARFGFCNGL